MSFFRKLFSRKKKKSKDKKEEIEQINIPKKTLKVEAMITDDHLDRNQINSNFIKSQIIETCDRHPNADHFNWICDSLVVYLEDEFYNTLLDSFIEENCIYFFGDEENTHHQFELFEGKFNYLEYSQICESRLEQYLKEFCLSPEELSSALDYIEENKSLHPLLTKMASIGDFSYFKEYIINYKSYGSTK